MNVGLIAAVLLAWPPLVAALFRAIGPARAVLVGLLGGYLLLPAHQVKIPLAGLALPLDKWNATGVALLAGALISDRKALLRGRPGWVDLPMVAWYLAPLIGLAAGVPGSSADVLDVMIGRGLGWVVPYATGRIYLGRGDGPGAVALALTISGLAYIPVCLYEEVVGPSRYLAGLIYGIPANLGMVDRLGGWRPEGFVGDGIALASYMALATVTAAWAWPGGRRFGRWPAWPATLALLVATLSCRGVYGYLILAVGLVAALLTRWLRTRAVLMVLLVLPLVYMGLRATGAWDGAGFVRAAALAGRGGTVAYRLRAEDEVIGRVIGPRPAFGAGNYIWHGGLPIWPDGAWLHALWMGGLVGLTLRLVALHAWPAVLALSRPRGRPDARQAADPSWALACWCLLHMVDGLHNTGYFTPAALIAGSLVGSRSSPPADDRRAPGPGPSPRSLPLSLIVSVTLLVAIEALGRWRSPGPAPSRPPSPGVDRREVQP